MLPVLLAKYPQDRCRLKIRDCVERMCAGGATLADHPDGYYAWDLSTRQI